MWKTRGTSGATRAKAAYTLVEVLVVIAVVAVLLGLAVPLLARIRSRGDDTHTLASLREIGTALTMYADASRDTVPVFFQPLPTVVLSDEPQEITVDGVLAMGHWFDHSFLFYVALRPALPFKTISVPGRPIEEAVIGRLGAPASEYFLSENFYATPEFWRSSRTQTAAGFSAQRWSSLLFPSSKGVLSQRTSYRNPQVQRQQLMTLDTRVESGVLWGDMSASAVRQGLLNPGVPNTFDHYASAGNASGVAMPVIRTRNGTRGRDR